MKTRLITYLFTLSMGMFSVHGESKTFKMASVEPWKGKALFIKDGTASDAEGMRKLKIYQMQYSLPLKFSPGKPIQFFHQTKDKKAPYVLALSVPVPPEVKLPFILLCQKDESFTAEVFDVDPSYFPYGSCMLANLTERKQEVILNEKAHVLAPTQNYVFPPTKDQKERAGLRIKDAESKDTVYSAMLMLRPYKRQLMLILDDPHKEGAHIVVKTLPDFLPAQPKK